MTIFTGKTPEKKEDTEHLNPEVVTETIPFDGKKKDEGAIAVVALNPRPRRHNSLASMCVLIAALIVFAIGILGGIYLYHRLAHRKYEGWCGVSYYEHQMDGYVPGDAAGYPGDVGGHPDDHQFYRLHGEFEEHVEIDKQEGKYEKIDVPEFAECKQATILHDFDKNLTAIVDKDNSRCFIIPLNRSMVKPPKDFWDLLNKLRSGYYLPDTEIVREKYHVIMPQVDNLSPFGYYIWKECRWMNTYRMVKEGEPVALSRRRRSAVDCSALRNSHYSLGNAGTHWLRNIEITNCL